MSRSQCEALSNDGEAMLVDGYQDLLSQCTAMLQSAIDKDWSTLIDLESRYLGDSENLYALEQAREHQMTESTRRETERLSYALLKQSAEVKRRLVARRDTLLRLLEADSPMTEAGNAVGGGRLISEAQ